MGKFKKNRNKNRHDPLDKVILENRYAQPSSRNKTRKEDPEDEEFVDKKQTSEILKQALQQQQELEEEEGSSAQNSLSTLSTSNTESEDEEEQIQFKEYNFDELVTISPEDEEALDSFMSKDSQKKMTIKEVMQEKLTEKRTEIETVYSDTGSIFVLNESSEAQVQAVKALVPVLQNYRSGKLPKLFKVIPKYHCWEYLLNLTEPDKWSAATMYQATRIFCSNLNDRMAQRFYNIILLPRLRDDIAESKRLNVHLYRALEKALFKPAAFFKGVVIPLCKAGNCTYREATIVGSALAKHSIPVLHSSAALLTIAEMDYQGVASIFMRVLLEKKYCLPYRVVNAVVAHFLRFMDDTRTFPLLWHQCLFTFVQLYHNDLTQEQKENLLKLISVHQHEHVTPEIRKILQQKTGSSTDPQKLTKMS